MIETVNGKVGPNIVLTASDVNAPLKGDFENLRANFGMFESRIDY
jgi:hypothetical protein